MIDGPVDKNVIKHRGEKLTLQYRAKKKADARNMAHTLGLSFVHIVKKSKPKRFVVYGR